MQVNLESEIKSYKDRLHGCVQNADLPALRRLLTEIKNHPHKQLILDASLTFTAADQGPETYTALLHALSSEQLEIAELLLDNGSDPFQQTEIGRP